MKILHLTLKKKWFDMILSGEKKAEYREIKDHWARRLVTSLDSEGLEWSAWEEMLHDMRQPFRRHTHTAGLLRYFGVKFRHYDAITFRNGYAKNAPKFTIELESIDLKHGRGVWGAEKGKFYFSLRLGRIVEVARAA